MRGRPAACGRRARRSGRSPPLPLPPPLGPERAPVLPLLSLTSRTDRDDGRLARLVGARRRALAPPRHRALAVLRGKRERTRRTVRARRRKGLARGRRDARPAGWAAPRGQRDPRAPSAPPPPDQTRAPPAVVVSRVPRAARFGRPPGTERARPARPLAPPDASRPGVASAPTTALETATPAQTDLHGASIASIRRASVPAAGLGASRWGVSGSLNVVCLNVSTTRLDASQTVIARSVELGRTHASKGDSTRARSGARVR